MMKWKDQIIESVKATKYNIGFVDEPLRSVIDGVPIHIQIVGLLTLLFWTSMMRKSSSWLRNGMTLFCEVVFQDWWWTERPMS